MASSTAVDSKQSASAAIDENVAERNEIRASHVSASAASPYELKDGERNALIIDEHVFVGEGVLQLTKGAIVIVQQYKYDKNWSVARDPLSGKRGYVKTDLLKL